VAPDDWGWRLGSPTATKAPVSSQAVVSSHRAISKSLTLAASSQATAGAGYLAILRLTRTPLGRRPRLAAVVYLESQTCKRARIGEGAARLWLASPLIRALGMTDKHAARAAPKPIAGSGTKSRRTAKSVRRIRARPAGEPRHNVGRWSLVGA